MVDYNLLSQTIDKQFKKGAFKSNFFEKDDLVSDLYLYLSNIDRELTETELLDVIKKKYFNYFEVYDIKGQHSYDDTRSVGATAVVKTNSQELSIYEYFEKIIWPDGIKCPKCKSSEVYPSKESLRQHECRDCGNKFSFSQNTNLKKCPAQSLGNLIKTYNLMLSGNIELKALQEKTEHSRDSVMLNYYRSLPSIINDEPLIKQLEKRQAEVLSEYTPYEEYSHQEQAISQAIEYYKVNSRGKIIHPCGSGKTHTSIKIIKNLTVSTVLVVLPSRALLIQQLSIFLKHFQDYQFYVFGSFSVNRHEFKNKNVIYASSNVGEQKKHFKKQGKNQKTFVFTTLQSFSEIEDAFPENFFDFALFDEAHKLTGSPLKTATKSLNYKSYKKALYLTATEKIYSNGGIGMDSHFFGETISKIYMKSLVEKGIIRDYNIVSCYFEDEEILKILEENKDFFVSIKAKLIVKRRILISVIGMIKALQTYEIKKVASYHPNVEESLLFAEFLKYYCKKFNLAINCYKLNSYMPTGTFYRNLEDFSKSKKAIIATVGCLQEGIDIPDLDAVMFSYPKKSKTAIVQAVGRCVRKHSDKKLGYVILPSMSAESYETIIQVLNALELSDDRISKFKLGCNYTGLKNISFIGSSLKGTQEFDHAKFLSAIKTRIGKPFLTFEEAKIFVRKNGITTIKGYKTFKKPLTLPKYPYNQYSDQWISWEDFLGATFKKVKTEKNKSLSYLHRKNYIVFLKIFISSYNRENSCKLDKKGYIALTDTYKFLSKNLQEEYNDVFDTWDILLEGIDIGIDLKFLIKIGDINDCWKHIENIIWKDGAVSPFDPSSKVYKCAKGRYKCKNSGKYFNVLSVSVFNYSKIDIRFLLVISYFTLLSKKPSKKLSYIKISKIFNMTEKLTETIKLIIKNKEEILKYL